MSLPPHAEGSTGTWLRRAAELRESRRWAESEQAVARAEQAATRPEEFAMLGDYLGRCDEHVRAAMAYDRALGINPRDTRILFNRAATRRAIGDLAGAESDYDAAIALDPKDPELWLNRSELRVQTPARNHVEALERRLHAGFDRPIGEVPIRYALAKEYEDLEEYETSWTHLAAGAALRRRHLNYDVRVDVDTVDWIIEAFGADVSSSGGCDSAEPIFIVGMPRSGTTLVERLLAGSPDVFPAGELGALTAAIDGAVKRKASGGARLTRRDMVEASSTVDAADLGTRYLELTRPRTGGTPRFTDKMPINYLYCGLIRRALPRAKVVHVVRHPLATAYALFKTLFNQGYPFSYDLAEIADYLVAYTKLMRHWRQRHPEWICDVSYERLVSDPLGESRRLYDFCGLEWQPEVVNIEARRAATTSASAAQVRRSIYGTSVDLWRHYSSQLEPVRSRLSEAGISL